jgi:hypothetical protein
VALLTFFALSAAAQQAPGPEPSPPAEKPPMAKPQPQTAPKPATPPKWSQSKSTNPLIGLTAISSDGSKIGDVRAVRVTPDGKVTALRVHSGGFLGLGGRTVEIREGKFTLRRDNVQLGLTAEEVSKLPAVKDGD